MKIRHLTTTTLAAVSLTITAPAREGDAIDEARKADKSEGIRAPDLREIKAIAEEGFIYGLPIVMNYAVMNEFVVDKNSGQYKTPINAIYNDAKVFTYKDTAVVTPNSDTPYSMLWRDFRAEPMVITVHSVEKDRYYSVQLVDGNAYKYGYIGTRATGVEAGSYLVAATSWQLPTGRAPLLAEDRGPSILPAGSGAWKPPGVVKAD